MTGSLSDRVRAVVGAFLTLFPTSERWPVAAVAGMGAIGALCETLGVAIIFPFVGLVTDPSALERSPVLAAWLKRLGAQSEQEAVMVAGVITIIVLAVSNSAAALNVFVQERFAARTKTRLSTLLFSGYLTQPYTFHIRRDAPSLLKVLLVDVPVAVNGIVTPLIAAASRAVMVLGILAVLFFVDPTVAATVGVGLGLAYALVYVIAGRLQRVSGARFSTLNVERQRVAQEALGGIKELQLLGRERHACAVFAGVTNGVSNYEATNRTVSQIPRFALETLAFGGLLIALVMLVGGRGRETAEIIPLLSLYAFAGHRLLPALQQIYASLLGARFYVATLMAELHHDLRISTESRRDADLVAKTVPAIQFRNAIRASSVTFTHEGAVKATIENVSFQIQRHECIGLVGPTGAGKTTMVDLLLGFYQPDCGKIVIDDVVLDNPSTILAWRRRIGYVPQHVFLANGSVIDNIAFGEHPESVSIERVRAAVELAQAEEFVAELPNGLSTLVGERGVKLSGGQRQRLGIARALYHQPDVLVFDEATSALDGQTEDAVMDAIRSLRGERTIILIAHKLRTVEACDRVILFDRGRLVAEGRYQELITSSDAFRSFVGRLASTDSAATP